MRIIGIELRVVFHSGKFGLTRREIAVLPCDISITMERENYLGSGSLAMNGTLHTDTFGDIAIPQFDLPYPGSEEDHKESIIKYSHKRV